MQTLRRWPVDGEIDLTKFRARLDAWLRTDPRLSMRRWDQLTASKGTQ